MATSQLKNYNGVVLVPNRQSRVIQAKNLEAAKAQMKKQHGPETDESGNKRWVCGLAVQSMTGHTVKP